MRPFLLFLLLLNISYAKGALPSFTNKPVIDSTIDRAKKLKELYVKSTEKSNSTEIFQRKFFDEFPNTFSELKKFYAYNNDTAAILYEEAQNHIINLFNKINTVNDTIYYKKIISISIGGHWDADAINYFQDGLRKRVMDKPDLIVYLLQFLPEKKIKSFWYFYFDGAHPTKQIVDFLQKIKSTNNKIYNLMIEAHNETLKK